MRVDEFDFFLPPERIALTPAVPRDSARMLHIKNARISDRHVSELPEILRTGDLLVANDTKVIPAQLFGLRPARGPSATDVSIEVTLHKDLGDNCWRTFLRPAKRVQEGDKITFSDALTATVTLRQGGEGILKFNTTDNFDKALSSAGVMPLPPYIARRRAADDSDIENYQTMFAAEKGSVAAPTAGLHFTKHLLNRLHSQEIKLQTITLHVGAGTFLPVTVDDTNDHQMHSEWGKITEEQAETINAARRDGGRIVAIGTTSLRLLESAATERGEIRPFRGETDIFITPGYRFRAVDCLMTNFHLPRSTLYMLVCAFSGTETMKQAYQHAIVQRYRFYSYGDACLLERNHD